jgi:c-di-AMP phosphodiesterase-like protein
MEQKNDYRLIIMILAGVLLIIAIQKIYFSSAAQERRMLNYINEINQKCPIMLDNETQLEKLEILNETKEIVYTCVLINSIMDSIIIANYEKQKLPLLLENTKTDPNKRIFRANNMTISYIYKDKNDELIFKCSLLPETYNVNAKNKNSSKDKKREK